VESLYEAAPIKQQTGEKQCEQRWGGNMGQSAISCTHSCQQAKQSSLRFYTCFDWCFFGVELDLIALIGGKRVLDWWA
jgi:hypothetical protein